MGSIIRYLFGCEIAFHKSWREENQYGALIEAARQMDERAKALLEEGQAGFWAEYQEQSRRLQNTACEREFERGFLLASRLLLEVIEKAEFEAPQQGTMGS